MSSAYRTPPDGVPDFDPAAASGSPPDSDSDDQSVPCVGERQDLEHARLSAAEALNLFDDSEQRVRQSFRPPQVRRGSALGTVSLGLIMLVTSVNPHGRSLSGSRLIALGVALVVVLLACIALTIYGHVTTEAGQAQASWGVARRRRIGPGLAIGLFVIVWLAATALFFFVTSTSASGSVALRWCGVTVLSALIIGVIGANRRRLGRSRIWLAAVSVCVFANFTLMIWRFELWRPLFGAFMVVLGCFQLGLARRDQRRLDRLRPQN